MLKITKKLKFLKISIFFTLFFTTVKVNSMHYLDEEELWTDDINFDYNLDKCEPRIEMPKLTENITKSNADLMKKIDDLISCIPINEEITSSTEKILEKISEHIKNNSEDLITEIEKSIFYTDNDKNIEQYTNRILINLKNNIKNNIKNLLPKIRKSICSINEDKNIKNPVETYFETIHEIVINNSEKLIKDIQKSICSINNNKDSYEDGYDDNDENIKNYTKKISTIINENIKNNNKILINNIMNSIYFDNYSYAKIKLKRILRKIERINKNLITYFDECYADDVLCFCDKIIKINLENTSLISNKNRLNEHAIKNPLIPNKKPINKIKDLCYDIKQTKDLIKTYKNKIFKNPISDKVNTNDILKKCFENFDLIISQIEIIIYKDQEKILTSLNKIIDDADEYIKNYSNQIKDDNVNDINFIEENIKTLKNIKNASKNLCYLCLLLTNFKLDNDIYNKKFEEITQKMKNKGFLKETEKFEDLDLIAGIDENEYSSDSDLVKEIETNKKNLDDSYDSTSEKKLDDNKIIINESENEEIYVKPQYKKDQSLISKIQENYKTQRYTMVERITTKSPIIEEDTIGLKSPNNKPIEMKYRILYHIFYDKFMDKFYFDLGLNNKIYVDPDDFKKNKYFVVNSDLLQIKNKKTKEGTEQIIIGKTYRGPKEFKNVADFVLWHENEIDLSKKTQFDDKIIINPNCSYENVEEIIYYENPNAYFNGIFRVYENEEAFYENKYKKYDSVEKYFNDKQPSEIKIDEQLLNKIKIYEQLLNKIKIYEKILNKIKIYEQILNKIITDKQQLNRMILCQQILNKIEIDDKDNINNECEKYDSVEKYFNDNQLSKIKIDEQLLNKFEIDEQILNEIEIYNKDNINNEFEKYNSVEKYFYVRQLSKIKIDKRILKLLNKIKIYEQLLNKIENKIEIDDKDNINNEYEKYDSVEKYFNDKQLSKIKIDEQLLNKIKIDEKILIKLLNKIKIYEQILNKIKIYDDMI